jgi:putative transposase
MRVVCHDVGCELAEFNGDDNTSACSSSSLTVALSRLVNGLKGVSSRRLRQEFPELAQHHRRAKQWYSASYFAGSAVPR